MGASAQWSDGTWPSLTLAYVFGLVAATGVCLPSFYFYGLLAGVKLIDASVRCACGQVPCSHCGRAGGRLANLRGSVSLGMIVFSAPSEWTQSTIALGLALPFVAGLAGVRSLFIGFADLTFSLPSCQKVDRACFLRRLTARLGDLLLDGDASDDLLALDTSRRLTSGLRTHANGRFIAMGFAATMIFYHLIGLGVAIAVFLSEPEKRRLPPVFRLVTAVVFWPLYLPILLAGPRRDSKPEIPPPRSDDDAMSQAISQVESRAGDSARQSGWLG